jgi:hypothetical protein
VSPSAAAAAAAAPVETGSVTADCVDDDDDDGGGDGVGFVLMKNPSEMAALSLYRIWFPLALGSGSLAVKCQ